MAYLSKMDKENNDPSLGNKNKDLGAQWHEEKMAKSLHNLYAKMYFL